jgi:hypothetical protein
MNTNTHFWSYLPKFFLEWEVWTVSDKSCRENRNTHFVFSFPPPPPKSRCLWDNVEKYCTMGQATDDNMAQALHAGYLRLYTQTQVV